MAIDFKYYLRGANIAIIEKDTSTGKYKSPSALIANGLMLEYSALPSVPDSEDDDLDISEEVAVAAVEYVKARFAENEKIMIKEIFT